MRLTLTASYRYAEETGGLESDHPNVISPGCGAISLPAKPISRPAQVNSYCNDPYFEGAGINAGATTVIVSGSEAIAKATQAIARVTRAIVAPTFVIVSGYGVNVAPTHVIASGSQAIAKVTRAIVEVTRAVVKVNEADV